MRKVVWTLGGIVALGVLFALLYPSLFGTRDGVRRIDSEARALQGALAQYKTEFGTFPTGDTRSVCKALSGNNPKNIRFIEWRERSTTPEGDFLDPWGTPYKIYFSGDWPLIRSAGENKQFNSSDQKEPDDYFGG